MTETALADLLAADLTDLEVALMLDGVHFAVSCLWSRCVVALGIDIGGTKHPTKRAGAEESVQIRIRAGLTAWVLEAAGRSSSPWGCR